MIRGARGIRKETAGSPGLIHATTIICPVRDPSLAPLMNMIPEHLLAYNSVPCRVDWRNPHPTPTRKMAMPCPNALEYIHTNASRTSLLGSRHCDDHHGASHHE